MDIIRQNAYRGLAELGTDEILDVLVEGTRYGRRSHGRRAAILAAAKVVRHRRDRAAAKIRQLCEDLLHDKDFRVQAAAIDALGIIGDLSASASLEDIAARDLDGRLRRRSREVLRDLREGASQRDECSALRQEVEELKTALAAMRERIDRLDA